MISRSRIRRQRRIATDRPRSRRWWTYLRLSLRTLILLVLIIGAVLGWMAYRARVQREAVLTIQRVGGHVRYDWEMKDGLLVSNGEPRWPRWLVTRVGRDYFGHVVSVGMGGSRSSDDELIQVAGSLDQLEQLSLNGSSVTDAGLAHFEGLDRLRLLGLEGVRITDDAMKHLEHATSLEWLDLLNVKIGDAGLMHLRGLIRLQFLNLAQSRVADAGLIALKGMTDLRRLYLSGTQVGDAGLSHIEGMTSLRELSLNRTAVSDAELVHLRGLTSLGQLHLEGTRVTDAGVQELQRALPGLRITH